MSKYFKIALVLFYVVLTILCGLLTLMLADIHISDRARWLVFFGWLLFCFSSAWLLTGLNLYFEPVRKPAPAEEELLNSAFAAVSTSAGYHKRVRLRVAESDEWEAYAIGVRTIIISKGMLQDVSANELEGVMAHELGHLIDYDTVIAAAYVQARRLTYGFSAIFRWAVALLTLPFRNIYFLRANRNLIRVNRPSLLHGIGWLILSLIVLHYLHFLKALTALTLFVITFSILNRPFRFLDLLLSRMTEYRQDAFARRLGFGKGLCEVLEKLAQKREQPSRPYFIVFHSTHPIIYNRIRRLQQDEGKDQRRTVNTNPTP